MYLYKYYSLMILLYLYNVITQQATTDHARFPPTVRGREPPKSGILRLESTKHVRGIFHAAVAATMEDNTGSRAFA